MVRTRSKGTRSKKEVKEFHNDFYLYILSQIKQGSSPKKIAEKKNYSIQRIAYYLANLKKWGHVKKVGYGTWELTKLGNFVTTKKFSWGTHESPKKIELWRLGYRFYIKHDNEVAGLKTQILKNGGKVRQGRILNCWITKGSETLDIYGTVSKADNLWDAAQKALFEIVTCRGYIEETNHIALTPMEMLRPDIIINTPETKRIANKIHENLGRIRHEMIEIDQSKTGAPEFEARDLKTAKNVLDNLAVNNKADILEQRLDRLGSSIEMYAKQIDLHMEVMKNINQGIKELRSAVKNLEK